ncbi:type 2 isopentenyl-diphosphate Delta-isomerase [Cohnella pontilimi]|uniref:Isopentenyl-diphosphate delta-isomerase n=1 Tax=Cohnella pontilimi TaxID=2564100 RepID=A0A4U0FBC9_9BACL|nr:type 2 isopentenyl-diphosphate Delta-isomerase [Cohnella pontilimi]TJY41484.1 type 2 isopentenyl-diphosphate Delta-isomerase [Cohnella pontilimi]
MKRKGGGGMADEGKEIARRKADHIRIVLEQPVQGAGVTAGFEAYRFRHAALPELAFEEVKLETRFLGRKRRTPLLISSMTGGTEEAGAINRRLARAAEERGWSLALGSMRAALAKEELASTFDVRREAPSVPVIANLGAVQLNYGLGPDDCRRAVELCRADALVLHLNALQEVFQPAGDTDFRGVLRRIEEVCRRLEIPVGVKEVGWGIDGPAARKLADAGAAFIDVAGAGGTSWSQVEKYRQHDPLIRAAAEAFADWGMPTAECVREVRAELPDIPLIASGGLASGIDAAKALALGADLAGFGRSLLREAASEGDVARQLERIELELRTAMFATGAGTPEELRGRLIRR